MASKHTTLEIFYDGWKTYMDNVRTAIAPLTQEQLGLRAAPDERTIGEMAQHIIAARVGWFHNFLGEGDDSLTPLAECDFDGAPQLSTAEILAGLDESWQFVSSLLAGWTPEDMQQTFPEEWQGEKYDLSRSWVAWHVLEHDLIHGGEISLTLGMHGLQAPRA